MASITTLTPKPRVLKANLADILATLEFCHPSDSDHYFEIRIPGSRQGTISGIFRAANNPRTAEIIAYRAAAAADTAPPAFYLTLNSVHADCYSRSAAILTPFSKITTGDTQIVSRTNLLIDGDAVRISGVSSTDGEHDAALVRIRDAHDWLVAQGWPEGLLGDSGNGGHILERLANLPNDEATKALVEAVLQGLNLKFSDQIVKIDTSVANAARISKIYGTPVRKGSNTPERPHRLARIISRPDAIVSVTTDMLRQVIDALPKAKTTISTARSSSSSTSQSSTNAFPPWFNRCGLPDKLGEPKPWKNGTIWVFQNHCPFSDAHADGAAFVARLASGAWSAGCHHETCHNENWKTLRKKFDQGQSAQLDSDRKVETPTKYNEINLSKMFADAYSDNLRFVKKLGWLNYIESEGRWAEDEKLAVYTLCKRLLKLLSIEAFNDTYQAMMQDKDDDHNEKDATSRETKALKAAKAVATALTSAAKVNNVLDLARSEPKLIATIDRFDTDNWLLNTPLGAVDLTTGVIRPAERTDYFTKVTKVGPIDIPTPNYDRFSRETMGSLVPVAICLCAGCVESKTFPQDKRQKLHDAEVEKLVSYMDELDSYCLTGDTKEQVLILEIGDGGNGKGLRNDSHSEDIFGLSPIGYSCNVPVEALLVSKGERHPTDLMCLEHARLAIARESESRGFNEGVIKRLSGGDPITARKMRMDYVTFASSHKLVIFGQHRPSLRHVDQAIKRRLHLIPFPQKWDDPPDPANHVLQADRNLRDKLRAEAPGRLHKLIQIGIKRLKRGGGFNKPATVRAASQAYLDNEDVISQWITDHLVTEVGAFLKTEDGYSNFRDWCERRRISPGRSSEFPDEIVKRIPGAARFRDRKLGSGISGVKLKKLLVNDITTDAVQETASTDKPRLQDSAPPTGKSPTMPKPKRTPHPENKM